MKQNVLSVSNSAKAVELNCAEIKERKEKCEGTQIELKKLKNVNTELNRKVVEVDAEAADLEQIKRRWNLCLNSLKVE